MRVLFTGATGVLGTASVPALLAAGHDVDAVVRTEAASGRLADIGARPVTVDLFEREQVDRAVSGADVVFHYATAIPGLSDFARSDAWEMNDRLRRDATKLLVDASLNAGVGRFVQQSITFVYADGGEEWIDEDSPVEPVSDRLVSALDAEREVERFREGGGTGVTLRHSRVYGPGEASRDYIAAVRARKMPVLGRGSNFVSSIHVDDVATALVAAIEVPDGTYNVSDDQPVTAWAYNASLAEMLGAPPPRRVPEWVARVAAGRTARLAAVSQRVSNARFRQATGWAPIHPTVLEGWRSVVAV